jgi:hypothetical protein
MAYFTILSVSGLYRVYQEERLIFREVIVSVILSKKVYMYMCFIQNAMSSHELQSAVIVPLSFLTLLCRLR